MYRRPKFLEKLLDIRCQMADEANYDVVTFTEIARTGEAPSSARERAVTRVVTDADRDLRNTPLTNDRRRASVRK